MCKVFIQLNCRSSGHKITSILYADGHTDRQADSCVPSKTFVLQGYENTSLLLFLSKRNGTQLYTLSSLFQFLFVAVLGTANLTIFCRESFTEYLPFHHSLH